MEPSLHDIPTESDDGLSLDPGALRGFAELSRRIMRLAHEPIPRVEFLRGLSELLLAFSDCDALVLRTGGRVAYRLTATARPEPRFDFEPLQIGQPSDAVRPPSVSDRYDLGDLVRDELPGHLDPTASCFTPYGSFWTSNLAETVRLHGTRPHPQWCPNPNAASLALIPFRIDGANFGLLALSAAAPGKFTHGKIESYEVVVETLGLSIAQRRVQAALHERVKELSCLYGIARVVEAEGGAGVDEALHRIVALLPAGWQVPAIAVARITLDGRAYATPDFDRARVRQSANIVIEGVRRGRVEVGYVADVPSGSGTPFLPEEEHLIGAVAREIGDYVARREAAAARTKLEEQLHHADRLATIGHLAAGVAHEINEPLSSILGFAQLAKKGGRMPESTLHDLDKVIAASLQAREIVNKLKIFARQAPMEKTWVSVDQVIDDALALVRRRLASEGIEVVVRSEGEVGKVRADPVQLNQVLLNLAVNAMQAMPDGGTLTVTTTADDGHVIVEVADTGSGMSKEVADQIFNPFFTTKDVGEGTGLGLSVVHGIVTSHGGDIGVRTAVGEGTTFTVRLPRSVSPGAGEGGVER